MIQRIIASAARQSPQVSEAEDEEYGFSVDSADEEEPPEQQPTIYREEREDDEEGGNHLDDDSDDDDNDDDDDDDDDDNESMGQENENCSSAKRYRFRSRQSKRAKGARHLTIAVRMNTMLMTMTIESMEPNYHLLIYSL